MICWLFLAQEVVFLGFNSERRCVRGFEAVVARLLKFVDEGAELREGIFFLNVEINGEE